MLGCLHMKLTKFEYVSVLKQNEKISMKMKISVEGVLLLMKLCCVKAQRSLKFFVY